jgi:hypothetical protein
MSLASRRARLRSFTYVLCIIVNNQARRSDPARQSLRLLHARASVSWTRSSARDGLPVKTRAYRRSRGTAATRSGCGSSAAIVEVSGANRYSRVVGCDDDSIEQVCQESFGERPFLFCLFHVFRASNGVLLTQTNGHDRSKGGGDRWANPRGTLDDCLWPTVSHERRLSGPLQPLSLAQPTAGMPCGSGHSVATRQLAFGQKRY